MAAIGAILEQTGDASACNCRLVVQVGEIVYVKRAQLWDCPSCGWDKRKKLAEMVGAEAASWLLTLTFRQPRAYLGGVLVVPDEHARCAPSSHVYEYRPGDWRWRTLGSCAHCCRRVSAMRARLRKVLRRLWPEVQYLAVYEDQKNGALHVHLALSGVPARMSRSARKRISDAWARYGGGYSNLRPAVAGGGGRLGWYLGKYLAKRQDQRMARGFRRWARSRYFAPRVRMREVVEVQGDAVARSARRPRVVGWRHPVLPSVISRARWWPAAP